MSKIIKKLYITLFLNPWLVLNLLAPYFSFKPKNFKRIGLVLIVFSAMAASLWRSFNPDDTRDNDAADENFIEAVQQSMFKLAKDIIPIQVVIVTSQYLKSSVKNMMRTQYLTAWSQLKVISVDSKMASINRFLGMHIKFFVEGSFALFMALQVAVLLLGQAYQLVMLTETVHAGLFLVAFFVVSNILTSLLQSPVLNTLKAVETIDSSLRAEIAFYEQNKINIDLRKSQAWHQNRIAKLVPMKTAYNKYLSKIEVPRSFLLQTIAYSSNTVLNLLKNFGLTQQVIEQIRMKLLNFNTNFASVILLIRAAHMYLNERDIKALVQFNRDTAEYERVVNHSLTFKLIQDENGTILSRASALCLRDFAVYLPSKDEITKTYLVHKSNMVFLRGQSYKFKGKNGTGKTTVLRAMADGWIYAHGRGVVGLEVDPKSDIVLLSSTALILNDITLLEMIAYPEDNQEKINAKRERVIKWLHRFNLPKFVELLDTKGNWANTLSAGQKQIISLLGLLYTTPKILLLDEVLVNLDSERKNIAKTYLNNAFGDTLRIVVDHAKDADVDYDHEFTIDENTKELRMIR